MTDISIQIRGLGKKYSIQSSDSKQDYNCLRDVIVKKAKRLVQPKSWNFNSRKETDFWALRDIDLDIFQGEKVAFIGKNGAGKSTLLKILSRVTHPSTGRATVHGQLSSLLEVGTGFHPELTGRENIYLNGSMMNMSHAEIKKKFDDIVDLAEIEQFLDVPIKRYSSGMKTRLGFAIASFLQNDIMILDEVLAVGDADFQKKCLTRIRDMSCSGQKTVLFVSHNLSAVQELCDRAVWLDEGAICQQGSVDEVIRDYYNYVSTDSSSYYWMHGDSIKRSPLKNEAVEITSMCLADEAGQMLAPPYPNNSMPFLKVTGRVLSPGASIGYILYGDSGTLMYMSTCNDFGQDHDPIFSAYKSGKPFTVMTKLPDYFLNAGMYHVYPVVMYHNGALIVHPTKTAGIPCLTLEVLRASCLNSMYSKSRVGVNAPLLEWMNVEVVES